MNSKPFSPQLYRENNELATQVVSEMLSQRGNEVRLPTREQYKSHDFTFVNSRGEENKIEVERKKVWTKSGEWQGWSTVDIPFRKSESKADFFAMTNAPGDALLIIPMSRVLSSEVSEKNTIYTKGEKFFNVPVEAFTLFVKEDGLWI